MNGNQLDDQYFINDDLEISPTGKYMAIKTNFGLTVKFNGDRKLIVTLAESYKNQVSYHQIMHLF